jgi:hypothetical protein
MSYIADGLKVIEIKVPAQKFVTSLGPFLARTFPFTNSLHFFDNILECEARKLLLFSQKRFFLLFLVAE